MSLILNKEMFYQFGRNITNLEINQNIEKQGLIINTNRSILYKKSNTNFFVKDKYYFIDVKGKCNRKYAKIVVKLYTYLDDKVQEEFILGVNSIYNIIKIHNECNSFRIDLFISGDAKVYIDNVNIQEIKKIKQLEGLENIKLKDKFIEDIFASFNLLSRNLGKNSKEKLVANALNDIWFIRNNYEEINVLDKDSWDNEKNNRSYLLSLMGFYNCVGYCDLIRETKDDRIIKHYFKIIEYFIDNYGYTSQFNGLAYNDMAVASRVFNWIYFYICFGNKLDDKQKNKLLSAIIYNANLLMEDHFNSRGTNHGLYQDIGSFTFLYCFKNKYSNYKIDDIVKNMENYFNFAITDEGILKEHSPIYQMLILKNMIYILRVYEKMGIDLKSMKNKIEKMKSYCTNILMPNDLFPRVSDTGNLSFNEVEDILTTKPKENVIYPKSGYAVFRNNIDKKEKSTYVFFYNAYNSFYHKHSDENGIIIYKNGEIITEAGANGYQYTDHYTKYAYSSWAHNTLIVNDKGLVEDKVIPNDYNYTATYIDDYNIDNQFNVSVTGVTDRYKNVKFVRKVNYLKKKEKIIVSDNVTSLNVNNYSILWNLAADLVPLQKGKSKIEIYRGDKRVALIKLKANAKFNINLIKGQKEPRLLGWIVNVNNDPIPTYVIKIDFINKKNIKLDTIFLLDD